MSQPAHSTALKEPAAPVAAPQVVGETAATVGQAIRPVSPFASDRVWLIALLVFFLAKQIFFVFVFGPFTGHDEVDHFFYVQRLAHGDGLGVVGEVLLPEGMAPFAEYVADYPFNSEVIQPPLYHGLLAGLSFLLPDDTLTQLYIMRLVAVVLGTIVVGIAYATAQLLFPHDLLVRAGVPTFVAFQPQFSFEAAIVNHDILVILLSSLVFYLSLLGLRDGFPRSRSLMIGLLSVAGLWTKVNFGLVLPVVALALLIWARDATRQPSADLKQVASILIERGALALLLPLVSIAPWFARNLKLYGDLTGTARLQDISDYGLGAQSYYEMITPPRFWQGLFEDFWGNYGWRHIPWDPTDYRAVAAVWGLMGIGALAVTAHELLARFMGKPTCLLDRLQFHGLFLSLAMVATLGFGVLYVGTVQFTQARFAFPAMISFALLSLIGLAAWLPSRHRPAGLAVLTVGLFVLTLWVTVRYVVPHYYGPGGGALLIPEG
jgi:hypothetical protein